ncbi:LytTR family DNA-binding domain-containing protein [Asticcacaulis sp. AND118]|uniref:LytTR family DNA-binding domain-containing protein n=1 Tax=Asticcacaulis sp. AND118 TaxID=2840468 RepID=UPI001CFFC7A6|nr:LytTR family DNA-binding domain-containing protein [Asticcacaulis sp. AND118]UDF03671.1 LytTR family transcriptional regulator DNA-binding domain-containing protein [Asticcacaulis sp. AND118]
MRETNAAAVHASSMAGPHWSETLKGVGRIFGSALGMALFLSLINAFGTGEIPLLHRLFYWGLLMVAGSFVAVGIDRLAVGYLRHRLHLEGRPWLYGVLLTALLTPSIALVVWAITPLFGHMSWDIGLYGRFLGPVGVISAAMTLLNVLLNREPQQSHAFAAPPASGPAVETPPERVAFLDRLPFKHQKADIYALSAEDHYLRVHTSAGSTLILMRLYDAIRELEGIEGSQTHRSWWVARDAIEDIRRQDGRVSLTLRGEIEAPVSRSYQKVLKADGWI